MFSSPLFPLTFSFPLLSPLTFPSLLLSPLTPGMQGSSPAARSLDELKKGEQNVSETLEA